MADKEERILHEVESILNKKLTELAVQIEKI